MFKIRNLLSLLFFVLIFQISLLCQQKVEPNNEFFNNWLREDYYNSLKEFKTPGQLFNLANGIISVYFNRKTDFMSANSNFNEGIEFKFVVLSKNSLKLTKWNDSTAIYLAELINEDNQTKIELNNFSEKVKYIKMDEKYSYPYSERTLVNDLFFTGVYTVNGDTLKKVEFTSDGQLYNLDNYTNYVLNLEGKVAPNYDAVYLQNRKNGKKTEVLQLHWKKTGNNIELFSTSDNSPFAVIKDKYMELIKIKK